MRQLRALTVPEAAEAVVRALAAVAYASSHRLARGQAKALHDNRVAIRRIRTLLRAYENFLPLELRSERTELTAIMRQTNALRDLEVHDGMLTQILGRRRIGKQTRDAVFTIRKAVRNHLKSGRSADHVTAQALITSVRALLRKFDESPIDTDGTLYSDMTASIVQRETNTIVKLSLSLERKGQVKRLHRARLSAKRLRYVVEPLPDSIVGVRDGITRLKRLQTLFGDIRDTQTLQSVIIAASEHSESRPYHTSANLALSVARADEDRLFATFLRRRGGGEITRLEHRLSRVVDGLRS